MDYLHDSPKQIIHGGERSICPYCYHFEVCRGVINQPCVKCEQFVDLRSVMPVVLCRDCKHSEPWYADKSRCFLWHESGIDVFNDGFCNYGEKREES